MTKNLLVVENDSILRQTFEGFLKSQTGFLNVMTARTTTEALAIVDQLNVHLLLIGFAVPEIDGFNFVCHIEKYYPHIRVIVLLDKVSKRIRADYKDLPAVVIFEKAAHIHLLPQRILNELQINFGGHLKLAGMSSFLQMMDMEKSNCTLLVKTKNSMGYLYIRKGMVVAAKLMAMSGLDAALEIISWKNASVEINFVTPAVERDINIPLLPLLLEASRISDEKMVNQPDLREHERHNCMFALDYDHEDFSNHGLLWDISSAGAYIETEETVPVGTPFTMTLFSADHRNRSKIKARVVRRDTKGMGISFENLTPEQKEIISALILDRLSISAKEAHPQDNADNDFAGQS